MRFNTVSLLSVCTLALRMGAKGAPTENVNTALIIDYDHNSTSLAVDNSPHGVTGIEFPVPITELEKRGSRSGNGSKGPRVPKPKKPKTKKPKTKKPKKPKSTPTTSKPSKPNVTSKATLKPTKSKIASKSASKTKSTKDPYGTCKSEKGAHGGKNKGKKGAKREAEVTDIVVTNLEKRSDKILYADDLELKFPTYPSSGTIITVSRYERDGVKAFGTRRSRPCDDDYNLRVLPFPRTQGDGLYNGERWDTEHVMDAQILQQFFMYLNDNLPVSNLPNQWWSRNSNTGKIGKYTTVRAERYIREFWQARKGAGNAKAIDHLLEVYPGTHQFTDELVLLGHGINRKKEEIFAERAGHCIGSSNWRHMDYFEKVDALRECILLAEYMEHREIRSKFQGVAVRIRDRLSQMEQRGGFLEHTTDYWARKKNDKKYRDAQGEVWKDQRLDDRWQRWITNFMKQRLGFLASEIDNKLRDLRKLNDEAQRDKNLSPSKKNRIDSRYRAIRAAWRGTITNPSPF